MHAAAVGAAWGGAVAAVKGRFGKKTAPVEAAGPTDSAAPGDAAVPASDAAAAAAASADGGPAAKALAAETAAAQPEGVTAEQLMAAEAGGADSEWTEVHSAEAGPAEPATAGDAHAPAIEPVHLEEGAEGMEVVSATQQLTLEDDDAAGTACVPTLAVHARLHSVACASRAGSLLSDHLSWCAHVPTRGYWNQND